MREGVTEDEDVDEEMEQEEVGASLLPWPSF